MYFANRVEETTLTTGLGDLTLAGAATNYRTFNSVFGTSRRFIYWIIDETNNIWENGIGYLSAASTLVRERVLSNSSGTTSPLSLSAGTKRVLCGNAEAIMAPAWPAVHNDTTGYRAGAANIAFDTVNSYPLQNGRFSAMPYLVLHTGIVTHLECEVAIASTTVGAAIRMGIYADNGDGRPGVLLAETADIPFDAVSDNTQYALTPSVFLTPGWYYIGTVSNDASGVGRVRKQAGALLNSPMGFIATGDIHLMHGGDAAGYSSWTSMPNPAPELTTKYAATSVWGMMPVMVFSS